MGWQDDPVVKGKWESDPIIDPAPSMLAAATPTIEIKAGGQAPQLLQPSANPYSAGIYPLGRKFTVGDSATFRKSDILTGVEERTYSHRITRVDQEADRVEINSGWGITDLMGNPIKEGNVEYGAPLQFTPAEYQVGRKWTAVFIRTEKGRTTNSYYDLHIVRREKVTVPAGEFDAFRIEAQGLSKTYGDALEVVQWQVPGLNFRVKLEWVVRNRSGRLTVTERNELISLRQQHTNT
jgi:hypothetical protein